MKKNTLCCAVLAALAVAARRVSADEGFTEKGAVDGIDKGGFGDVVKSGRVGSEFKGGCHNGGGTANLALASHSRGNGADEIGGECDGIAVYGRACNIHGETTGLISTASKTGWGRAGYKF